jgi:hypothetical protein
VQRNFLSGDLIVDSESALESQLPEYDREGGILVCNKVHSCGGCEHKFHNSSASQLG